MRQLNVDIHGPVGAGKTVLLSGIYEHLSYFETSKTKGFSDLKVSDGLRVQWERMKKGDFPRSTSVFSRDEHDPDMLQDDLPASETDEWIECEMLLGEEDPLKLRFSSHAGENVLVDGSQRFGAKALINQLVNARHASLLVAVLNPFQSNETLATAALYSLIATNQRRLDLGFLDAFYLAARALFHVERRWLDAEFPQIIHLYGQYGSELELNFDVTLDERSVQWSGIEKSGKDRLVEELARLVSYVVGETRKYRETLNIILNRHENAMVVLTHMDLASYLSLAQLYEVDAFLDKLFSHRQRTRLVHQHLAFPILDVGFHRQYDPGSRNVDLIAKPISFEERSFVRFFDNLTLLSGEVLSPSEDKRSVPADTRQINWSYLLREAIPVFAGFLFILSVFHLVVVLIDPSNLDWEQFAIEILMVGGISLFAPIVRAYLKWKSALLWAVIVGPILFYYTLWLVSD